MKHYEVKHNGVTIEYTHIKSHALTAKAKRFGQMKRDHREQEQIQFFEIEHGIKKLIH
ncbi:MAG: hypothetical protein KGI11_09065 [Thaumarchaeota archaeon]|nr:hypothetical protein [Nitrososphaerota archaeon]